MSGSKRSLYLSIFCFTALIIVAFSSATLAHIKKTPTIQKILLVVADEKEAEPVINKLNLQLVPHIFAELPMQGFKGNYRNLEILLVITGKDPVYQVQNVGTQAAALTTYLGIQYFRPELVISLGTAGGLEKENTMQPNDIYISDKIYFHHRRIPFGNYVEYGAGKYNSFSLNNHILQKAGLKKGKVCSGDSFDQDKTDQVRMKEHGCIIKEMEAASVAWVSMLMKKPMFALKGITDKVGNKNGYEEYKKNFPIVTQKLTQALQIVLEEISHLKTS